MGVQIKKLINPEPISFRMLEGKKLAIDTFNILYQFITTIRQRDGTPLMNQEGKITSHVSGLFYRTAKLIENGIRPCFVFDGKPPEFKLIRKEREKKKKRAEKKLEEAKKRGDPFKIQIFSKQSARLHSYMIDDSKRLLTLLGIPWIQAPSEGEAQAAVMTKNNEVWATVSQDFDALLFGSLNLIRNLTVSGKRKLPKKNMYVTVSPELIKLNQIKSALNFSQEELIALGILVGTDFNPGGIHGIGPIKARDLIKKKGIEALEEIEWKEEWPEVKTIMNFFLNPPYTKNFNLKLKKPEVDKVNEFLIEENDFSENRVTKTLNIFERGPKNDKQEGLSTWF